MVKLKLNCWIIVENSLIGTENQCLGVYEALARKMDCALNIKRITLKQPWKSLSPYIGFECAGSFSPSLDGPWPDLIIAGGRKSIAACRYIKRKSGGKSFIAFMQDPRACHEIFDLIAAPAHDPARGENVIVTAATPNRITNQKLTAARGTFPDFANAPSPRVAVLIGGKSKAFDMGADTMHRLATQITALNAYPMITTSRRTGKDNEAILKDALKDKAHYMWDGQGENPYFALLSYADYILVSADSASMLSEAGSTGKPVYMIPMDSNVDKRDRRIDKLHTNLQDLGVTKIFDGTLERWDYQPLNDAETIADALVQRLGKWIEINYE